MLGMNESINESINGKVSMLGMNESINESIDANVNGKMKMLAINESINAYIYGKMKIFMHDLLMKNIYGKIQWFTLKSPLFESIQK